MKSFIKKFLPFLNEKDIISPLLLCVQTVEAKEDFHLEMKENYIKEIVTQLESL
jgi:hypothetical protein